MTGLQLGLNVGAFVDADLPPRRELLSFGVRCEDLGYDSVWLGDHLFWRLAVMDAPTLLTAFLATTDRIRVGTDIIVPALRHPVIVAKAIGTMTWLWPNRVAVGVGVGGENAQEFRAVGVPVRERGRRLTEAIQVMRALWTEERVSGSWKDCELEDVSLSPAGPAPPIYVGGRADAALRRAGQHGDGWLGYLVTPEGFSLRWNTVLKAAADSGKNDQQQTGLIHVIVSVDRSHSRAENRARRYLVSTYGEKGGTKALKYCLVGSPAQVLEGLTAYREAGATIAIVRPLGNWSSVLQQTEDLAAAGGTR